MKKLFLSLILILVIAAASIQNLPVAAAQSNEEDALTFSNLGLASEMVLRGPYDTGSIKFTLPPTWELEDGARLEIMASTFSTAAEPKAGNNQLGAILEVSLNDQLLYSIPLMVGENLIYEVPVSLDSLASAGLNGGHKLSFFLDASVDCNMELRDTTVIIDRNSRAVFPHSQAELDLDLRRLPWPIYLPDQITPAPVTVVLPAKPSTDELQAGFVVMGALGRMTDGNISLSSITTDQLTEAILGQSHIIAVGKASSFPMFSEVEFPVGLAGEGFSSPELGTDDGVIQILPSPWNDSLAVLMVSGNTDLAVVKASQALSTQNLQTGNTPYYAIVAQVNPFPLAGETSADSQIPASGDISFSEMGFDSVSITGIGSNWVGYNFNVPAGYAPSEEAYVDIKMSASNLIEPYRSEGVVYLNDVQIGSLTLSSDTSNIITSRIYLPSGIIRSGSNSLDLVYNLIPRDICSLVNFTAMWVTIYPDSMLHLPLTPKAIAYSPSSLRDFKAYPFPFSSDPALNSTTFVLSEQDPASWFTAGRMAFDLGRISNNQVLGLSVAFDANIPDERKINNLIFVGEPKNFSVLSQLKDSMPAYFESGSNTAVLESQQVIYQISPEKSLGYLQLFPSPWNKQATILGIFGTTSEGFEYAADAILDTYTRSTLTGNFISLDKERAIFIDTRTGLGLGSLSANLGTGVLQTSKPNPTAAPDVLPAVATYNTSREFTFTGILVVLGLILMTVVVILVFHFRRNTKPRGSRSKVN